MILESSGIAIAPLPSKINVDREMLLHLPPQNIIEKNPFDIFYKG